MPAFVLPNLGPWEILVILVVALLVFGKRLPDVGRSLGRSLTQFRRGLRDLQDEIEDTAPPEPRLPKRREPPRDEAGSDSGSGSGRSPGEGADPPPPG